MGRGADWSPEAPGPAPAPGCHRGLEGVVSVSPTRLPGCGSAALGVFGELRGTVGPFPVPSCLHLPTTRTCLAFLICTAQGG